MDDAGFTSEKAESQHTKDEHLDIKLDGKGWDTTITFCWRTSPDPDEVARQIDIKRAERDLKLICIRHSEPSAVGWILAKIHFKYAEEMEHQFVKLMKQLRDVGISCMCTHKEQHHVTTTLIKEVLADATRVFTRVRRSEIAIRLAVAFLGIFAFTLGIIAFLHTEFFKRLVDPVAHVLPHRTTLTLVFFAGVSLSAWASYMQRSMSVLDWTAEKDLDDLRTMLADPVHPTIRVMYIYIFAFISLLLLHLGVVQIKLGAFDTSTVLSNFKIALFLGLMLGLAERTLPTAMSRRANDLAAGLGGDRSAEHAVQKAKAVGKMFESEFGARQKLT